MSSQEFPLFGIYNKGMIFFFGFEVTLEIAEKSFGFLEDPSTFESNNGSQQ
jgi:hypothetical protein